MWFRTGDRKYTVDLVSFRSFTRYIADGVGCTTYSFTKTLSQPVFHPYGRVGTTDRPDVWFVTEDGSTLSACVADARECLEAQGLPFLDKVTQPRRAFETLCTERSTNARFGELGIHLPGSPDSPAWRDAALGIGHLFLDDPRIPMRSAPVLRP